MLFPISPFIVVAIVTNQLSAFTSIAGIAAKGLIGMRRNKEYFISRNEIKRFLCSGISLDCRSDRQYACDLVDKLPTLQVISGYNLLEDTPSLFECSECHWECWDTYCGDTKTYNYCPNCGARIIKYDTNSNY